MRIERDQSAVVPRMAADGNPISLLVEFRRKEPDLRLVVYDVWNDPPERYRPLVGRNRLCRGVGWLASESGGFTCAVSTDDAESR